MHGAIPTFHGRAHYCVGSSARVYHTLSDYMSSTGGILSTDAFLTLHHSQSQRIGTKQQPQAAQVPWSATSTVPRRRGSWKWQVDHQQCKRNHNAPSTKCYMTATAASRLSDAAMQRHQSESHVRRSIELQSNWR
jgi:hypothetical protein